MTKAIKNTYYYNNQKETLNKEDLIFFRNELEEKKEHVIKMVNKISKELNSSNEPKDEADHACLAVDNLTNNSIMVEQQKTLNQINRSLNRIALGTYGICNLCEETINIERLKVKIFAEYCVSCREIIEKQK